MLAFSSLLDPHILQLVLADPSQLNQFIDVAQVRFVIKIAILTILLLYILFSVIFIIQMKRTEQWLMSLKRYNFPRWAWIHLVLAILGWILAAIVL